MPQSPPLILIVLWSCWVIQAVLSVVKVRKFARLYDHPDSDPADAYRPLAAVIVPFKGMDPHLADGVKALCAQDYPDYHLLLVVDSKDDPAYAVLSRELENDPDQGATILVAGPAGPHEGQKIHNQLFAIDHLLAQQSAGQEPPVQVWVFADSDAVPGPDWLGRLVNPLAHEDLIGVTTGYRWLIPTPAKRTTVWTHLASVMNSSVACLMGRDKDTHAWGGSMAVKASTARKGHLRDRLVGALCDDYQFSRMSRDLGLRIHLVPRCLVATPVDFSLASLINFAHRQYLLTRVYAPKLFITGLVFTSLYVAGWVSAWAWLGACLWRDPTNPHGAWPALAIVTVFVAGQVRTAFRRCAVRRALGQDVLEQLHTTLCWDRWATPVWMTLHWLLIVRSAFGRTMRWRGIRYRLFAPQRVERLDQ